MKKNNILLIILFCLFFIPCIVKAETCEIDKIKLDSITIDNKSDNIAELDTATINNKNINLNLSMSEVGDNITYKIIVKNDSDEDYELDKNSLNINSEYIDYSLEFEDNTNIIKANSNKIIFLKVVYKNGVPEESFVSGTFNDNKTIKLNLSTNNPTNIQNLLKNPNTGNLYLLIIVLLFIITLLTILKKPKHTKYIILIIGTTIIIPICVQALCKCDIEIESKIRIDKPVEEDVLYLYGRIYNVSIGDSINITKIEDQNLIEQYGDTLYVVGEACLSTDKNLMFNIFSMDPVFFKYKIKDNIIKEISIEYLFNNIQYSLVYNPSNYESNKQFLKDSFGENNCSSVYNNDNYYYCQNRSIGGNANINGDIGIFINNFSCYISQNKTYFSSD